MAENTRFSRERRTGGSQSSYASLIEDAPELVIGELTRLHNTRSLSRLELMDALARSASTFSRRQWNIFSSTRLHLIFLHIAMDDEIYELQKLDFDIQSQRLRYTVQALQLLEVCVDRVTSRAASHNQGRSSSVERDVDMLLKGFPLFANTLWSKRRLFEYEQDGLTRTFKANLGQGGTWCFAETVVNCMLSLWRLFHATRQEQVAITHPTIYIFLYYWTYSGGSMLGEEAYDAVIWTIFRDLASPPRLETFFQRAFLSDGAVHPDDVVSAILHKLNSKNTTNARLHKVMAFFVTLRRGRPLFRKLQVKRGQTPLKSITMACQRQLCKRGDGPSPGANIIIQDAICLIYDYFTQPETSNAAKNELETNVENMQLVPLISRIFVQAVADNERFVLVPILGLLEFYVQLGKRHTAIQSTMSREPFRPDLLRTSWKVWLPTLRALQTLPGPLISDVHECRRLVTSCWEVFGKAIGLDEILAEDMDESDVPGFTRHPTDHWPVSRGCAWKECMCSGRKVDHRLRVCKGCWFVLYCSRRCQRSDWVQGGHREVCRPPSGVGSYDIDAQSE